MNTDKQADQILREDAKKRGVIRATGRGLTKYLNRHGILTKKQEERIRKTEITGLDFQLGFRVPGERHSKKFGDEE